MRIHVNLDDELVAQLDKRVGPRGRSAFIAASVKKALENGARFATDNTKHSPMDELTVEHLPTS